ncbi:MAG: HEAT repeat domain-containing protein [Chrysiogenales bacterium]|nr:MAG: HEAT repeat domain-containing protein [Chrysiogenales bacterium]
MKRIVCSALIIVAAVVLANAQEEKVKKTAQEYIADLSSGGDEKTLLDAARWLGEKKEKDAIPGLINLLGDSRESLRLEAAISLGLIGEESAADAINKAFLNDESAEVRYAALLSTMRIGSKKSIDAYRISKEKETDPFIQDLLAKMEDKAKGK